MTLSTGKQLPIEHANVGAWGGILNGWLKAGHRADGSHSLGRVVTEYGADPTGATPSATAINNVIAGSSPGEAILFPGGTYTIEQPILLKADRAYIALGSVTLKQKASTEIDAMVMFDPAEAYPRRNLLWVGIHLDGDAVNPASGEQTNNTIYTPGSNYTRNRGMVLDSAQFCNFFDLAIRGCGNDALTVTGSSLWDFNQQGSTNHFVSPYIYGNGGRGVVFGPMADDNHVYDGDIGDQNYDGVHFSGGSSSLRACTVWGTRFGNGIVVGAPSNQIIGCQVEGHAQHGIAVLTRYANWTLIANCKIYDNSIESNGGYDGIYVNGDPGYVNTVGLDASGPAEATPAAIQFYPRQDFDYSGPNAITFTIADGTTTQTVNLNASYAHLAAVAAAVDAQLDGAYLVTVSGGYVRVEAATAGAKTLVVGGTNAAAITGAAGYPVSYTTILGNFIYSGIGDFYLDGAHNVDPAGGGGWTDSDGVFHAGSGWNGQRHGITLDVNHAYAVVNGNNAGLVAPGAGAVDNGVQPIAELQHGGPSYTMLSIYGLTTGDEYNGVLWSSQAEEDARLAANPRTLVPGAAWWREDAGLLKFFTGPSRDRIERVLSSKYDVEGGTFTSNGTTSQDVSIPNVRFDTAYTILLSPTWATTWWVTGKTGTQFTVHFGTAPSAGTACDYSLVRQSG